MAVTQIDLDEEALAAVMRITGVRTKKEAVNLALQEYAARERRLAAYKEYREDGDDWGYQAWKAAHDADKLAYRR